MQLEEYVDEFNGAPMMLHEFAESALDVVDSPALRKAAQEFLESQEHFESVLNLVGVDIG